MNTEINKNKATQAELSSLEQDYHISSPPYVMFMAGNGVASTYLHQVKV